MNNNYFTVRIQLQYLETTNEKLEYRSLYSELYEKGFRGYFFDKQNQEICLPEGMYSILSFDYGGGVILRNAEQAIEMALKEFYPHNWHEKYTVMVSGPSAIYHKYLEPSKESATLETDNDKS